VETNVISGTDLCKPCWGSWYHETN